MMAKKVLFLNVLLLVVIAVVAQQLVSDWNEFESEYNIDELVIRTTDGAVSQEPLPSLVSGEELSHDFFVIAERDLFSPDRRPAADGEEEGASQSAPEFPKKPRMNGVQVVGGESKALLTIFDSAKSQGEARVVSVGDVVQGYVVTQISDTTLTLTWNDQNELIDMLDTEATKQTPRPTKKLAALNIIRIGTRYAAVETTSPETAETQENKGVQVAVVGGQAAQGQRGQALAGRAGRAGQMGASGLSGSRSGMGTGGLQRGGLSSSMGLGRTGRTGMMGQTGRNYTRPRY